MIKYKKETWRHAGPSSVWFMYVARRPLCHVCYKIQVEEGRCMWCNVAAHQSCRIRDPDPDQDWYPVCRDCQAGDL